MARYRLRFVLQELDLAAGRTVIGRSLECQLTIDDPLVSRRHAVICVEDAGASIEDLGSRNGVKVNGVVIGGATSLEPGDRIRIGTQELIFSRVDEAGRAHARATGQLRLCARCRLPYPREMVACPTCEATEQTDEDAPTAAGSPRQSGDWTLRLFVEALDRALRLGRTGETVGLVRKAAARVDEILAAGDPVDEAALAALAIHATGASLAAHDPTWAVWAIRAFGRSGSVPPPPVVQHFEQAAAHYRQPVRAAVGELVARLETLSEEGTELDSRGRTMTALRALGR